MPGLVVTQRPARPADQDFLMRVFASTRTAELAPFRGDAAASHAFVRMQFLAQSRCYQQHGPASRDAVVEVVWRGITLRVGRLWTDRLANSIHLLDIALLPEWRGQGVGSVCLQRLQHQAAQRQQALTLQVRQGNPARRLYERLGFCCTGPQVELHQGMKWRRAEGAPCVRKESCDEQA